MAVETQNFIVTFAYFILGTSKDLLQYSYLENTEENGYFHKVFILFQSFPVTPKNKSAEQFLSDIDLYYNVIII